MGRLFFVGGAKQCGTTWLYNVFATNPDIWLPPVKELHCYTTAKSFDRWRARALASLDGQGDPDFAKNVREPVEDADRQFLRAYSGLDPQDRLDILRVCRDIAAPRPCAEIDPNLLTVSDEDIAKIDPASGGDALFLFILRDPVDRYWSWFKKVMGKEGRLAEPGLEDVFLEMLAEAPMPYSPHLPRWRRQCGDRILVADYADLRQSPGQLLSRIAAALGVTDRWNPAVAPVNVGPALPMASQLRSAAEQHFGAERAWMDSERRRNRQDALADAAAGGDKMNWPSGGGDFPSFDIARSLNPLWKHSRRGQQVSVEAYPLLRAGARVFAIGSCFAVEIRKALRAHGFDVYPKYDQMPFDPSRQQPGKLPHRDNVNHYDTFVIRQEIERALGELSWGRDDFWTLDHHPLAERLGWSRTYQDPYRRTMYAGDLDSLAELSETINKTVDAGLEAAEIIIITLGLTECWRNRSNGLYICLGPKSETDETLDRLDFHPSSYSENYQNLAIVMDKIRGAYPDKEVVLSVSPVPLGRTWTGQDVVVANMTSKSILRAAAAQVCAERPYIHYWPSFEYASRRDVYEADGRHVTYGHVEEIITSFIQAHRAPPR